MASTYDQVAMTTSAAIIIASNANRKKLVIKNTGSNIVYIGNDNSVVVTAANANGGYPIEVDETFYLNDYTGDVYGLTSTSTSTVSIIEEELA